MIVTFWEVNDTNLSETSVCSFISTGFVKQEDLTFPQSQGLCDVHLPLLMTLPLLMFSLKVIDKPCHLLLSPSMHMSYFYLNSLLLRTKVVNNFYLFILRIFTILLCSLFISDKIFSYPFCKLNDYARDKYRKSFFTIVRSRRKVTKDIRILHEDLAFTLK